MATNPWGVNTAGSGGYPAPSSPTGLGGGASSMLAPRQPAQAPQTFTQMQKQGVARPPAPAPVPVQMTPGMIPQGQPGYPRAGTLPTASQPGTQTRMVNGVQVPLQISDQGAFTSRPTISYRPTTPPGVTVPPQRTDGGNQAGNGLPNLEQLLMQNLGHPATVGGNGPLGGHVVASILQSLANPSAYNSDQALNTFNRLNSQLSEGFDQQRQGIREEMARRGLGDSTVYGGRLGDVAIQQSRAQSDLAGQIATQQAQQYAQDQQNAIAQALGYNTSQQQQNLDNAQFNQGSYQQALQNLLGYGQQSFENQVTSAQLNNSQQQQAIDFLMALFGQT